MSEAQFGSGNPAADPAVLRQKRAGWLVTQAGADWFHALAVKAAGREEDSALARLWLQTVTQAAGVGCFPAIDPDDGTVHWPAETGLVHPGVSFGVADAPALAVVRVDRFATTPEAAEVQLSLGPDDTRWAAFVDLWDLIRRTPQLRNACRTLGPLTDALTCGDGPKVVALLDQLLGVLERAEPPQEPQLSAAYDAYLSRLRDWAAAEGFAVLPAEWTFTRGGSPPSGEGLSARAVFRRDIPCGGVFRVKAFGLVRGGEVVRPGEVVVSAGPPPRGLTELETAAEAIPGAVGEDVRRAFRELRPAGAGGYLELAATDLYLTFWDRAYPVWALDNSPAASAFAEGLAVLLADTFGLVTFAPSNYRDYPAGWVLVPPGTQMNSGRVVRQLRPGLVRGDALHVPARVEAE